MTAEIRTCPLSGRTVILAPERANRPVAFERPKSPAEAPQAFCPFCPGNEWDTPGTLYELADETGWRLRVVPNKFPAVGAGADAFGHHEVVIECREHWEDPTQLGDGQLAETFVAWRERMKVLQADPRIKSVVAFQNIGADAGASLPHLHSQILALPIVPEVIQIELDHARHHRERTGDNLILEMSRHTDQIVDDNGDYRAICPFAPRFEYETWIVPTRFSPRFEMTTNSECVSLARILRRVMSAMNEVLDRPACNWLLHSAPAGEEDYQWHLEILPRVTPPAGFEWASGVFINPVPPAAAAAVLRSYLR